MVDQDPTPIGVGGRGWLTVIDCPSKTFPPYAFPLPSSEVHMSEDAVEFVGLPKPVGEWKGLEALERVRAGTASKPLCETSVPEPKQVLGALIVTPVQDGGYVVTEFGGAIVFACGTVNEACEYVEDRLSLPVTK